MSFKNRMKRPTEAFSAQIDRLKEAIESADAVLIGAGAGLSSAAGLSYSGARFTRYFGDFEEKYGFHDMYSGGFYPYRTPEEHWAYWSRFVLLNRYDAAPGQVYLNLLKVVKDKDFFVLTTNVDHQFQRSGFDKTRLFYTQGDYGLLQCAKPCAQKTYENEALIRSMVERQKDMRIPAELVPKCPVCGAPMMMNLRCDGRFVEDDGWRQASRRYDAFVREQQTSRLLLLELGVGYNTPVIIKYPFWKLAARNERAIYACLNLDEVECPPQIAERSICIQEDIGSVLQKLLNSGQN